MPFHKNEIFDLEIINEAYGIQVNINGQRFAGYAHRTDPSHNASLEIYGGVALLGVAAA